MRVEISAGPLEPLVEIQRQQQGLAAQYGGTAIFIGTMRDFNRDRDVSAMTLEHYPGMTEKVLSEIAAQAMTQWPLLDLLLIHRVGDLLPGQPIVVIAVWSAHRAEAFEACRFLIEELKARAPLWKKETLGGSGTDWV